MLSSTIPVPEYDEDDTEEVLQLTGPVFMAPLGKGRCRGPGWTVRMWPVLKGYKTAQDCAEACAKRKGCTAFDVSNTQADKTMDCVLYGHKRVAPASGVPGTCYILSDKPYIHILVNIVPLLLSL